MTETLSVTDFDVYPVTGARWPAHGVVDGNVKVRWLTAAPASLPGIVAARFQLPLVVLQIKGILGTYGARSHGRNLVGQQ